MRKKTSIFFSIVSISLTLLAAPSRADVITWSGQPTAGETCPGCEFGPYVSASDSSSGDQASVNAGFGNFLQTGGQLSGFMDAQFTIAAPTEIALQATAGYGAQTTGCTPIFCASILEISASFSGGYEISGNGITYGAPLAGTNTVTLDCRVNPLCTVSVNASDTATGQLLLGPGTYDVSFSFQASNSSLGSNSGSMGFSLLLTDPPAPTQVPEPSMFPIMFGIALLAARGAKR